MSDDSTNQPLSTDVQYGVGAVPYHTHNGIDSPKLTQTSSSGVTSVTASGSGITASPTTGDVIVANTGVTSLVAGTGISVSGATGDVVVSLVASGVTPGLYNNAGVVVDTYGRITSIQSQTPTINSGPNSRGMNTADSQQTIAHGLSGTPNYVAINGSFAAGSAVVGVCNGTYNGSSQNYAFSFLYSSSSSSSGSGGSYIVNFVFGGGTTRAVLTIDATNIYLNWSLAGTSGANSGTFYFTWTAMIT
jgi:hypothetical protein